MTDSILKALARGEVPVALVEEELRGTADMSDDRCDLQKLCQAIVDHTHGDGFWIGEILLDTIKRETGYKYEPAVNQEERGE